MLNQCTIQGRLVDDPKSDMIVHTANGDRQKYKFTLATQDEFGRKATHYIPCAAWGRTGEFITKWFKKGYMIFVNGRLTTYKDFEDDGRTVVELTVDRADFPNDKKAEDEPIEVVEEDLPF